jgi:hypothetical protein
VREPENCVNILHETPPPAIKMVSALQEPANPVDRESSTRPSSLDSVKTDKSSSSSSTKSTATSTTTRSSSVLDHFDIVSKPSVSGKQSMQSQRAAVEEQRKRLQERQNKAIERRKQLQEKAQAAKLPKVSDCYLYEINC